MARAGSRKPKLGSGERFRQLREKLAKRGVEDPDALAAYIGRSKYGNQRYQELAAAGRRRAAARRQRGSK